MKTRTADRIVEILAIKGPMDMHEIIQATGLGLAQVKHGLTRLVKARTIQIVEWRPIRMETPTPARRVYGFAAGTAHRPPRMSAAEVDARHWQKIKTIKAAQRGADLSMVAQLVKVKRLWRAAPDRGQVNERGEAI